MEWGKFNYGPSPVIRDLTGKLSGNCGACRDWFFKTFKAPPPCKRCPKYKLYPDNFGLYPENEKYVRIFEAAVEHTTDFGGTVNLTNANQVIGVINFYRSWFPNEIARQTCFEMVMMLNRVAREGIHKMESLRSKSKSTDDDKGMHPDRQRKRLGQ